MTRKKQNQEIMHCGGVITFNIPGLDLPRALDILYKRGGIECAVFGGDLAGIRMCPHIYIGAAAFLGG
jgi:hypothetical protein